jgi:hypothetical protein
MEELGRKADMNCSGFQADVVRQQQEYMQEDSPPDIVRNTVST